jgi:hypothetical protein
MPLPLLLQLVTLLPLLQLLLLLLLLRTSFHLPRPSPIKWRLRASRSDCFQFRWRRCTAYTQNKTCLNPVHGDIQVICSENCCYCR